MTTQRSLVERLRIPTTGWGAVWPDPLLNEAADEIDRLTALCRASVHFMREDFAHQLNESLTSEPYLKHYQALLAATGEAHAGEPSDSLCICPINCLKGEGMDIEGKCRAELNRANSPGYVSLRIPTSGTLPQRDRPGPVAPLRALRDRFGWGLGGDPFQGALEGFRRLVCAQLPRGLFEPCGLLGWREFLHGWCLRHGLGV